MPKAATSKQNSNKFLIKARNYSFYSEIKVKDIFTEFFIVQVSELLGFSSYWHFSLKSQILNTKSVIDYKLKLINFDNILPLIILWEAVSDFSDSESNLCR